MLLKPVLFALSVFAMVVVATCFSGCGDSTLAPTGRTSSVQSSSLVGKATSHRTGEHDFQFSWRFDADRFEISGDSIPEDLLKDLGTGVPAAKITGTGKNENDNIVLTTEANGETLKCEMEIFSTGPIRIQSSAAQYTFSG